MDEVEIPEYSEIINISCRPNLLAQHFFNQSLLSRTLTTRRTAGKRREPAFTPLYHFHPLTNIPTFICNFACEMTITNF